MGNEEGNFIQFAYGDKHSVHRIRSVATDSSGHMAVLENGGRVKIFDISEMHAKPPSEKGEDEVMSAFKLMLHYNRLLLHNSSSLSSLCPCWVWLHCTIMSKIKFIV